MKQFFRRVVRKPASSKQTLGSSVLNPESLEQALSPSVPNSESSEQALGPSIPDPGFSKQALGPSIVADVVNARVDIVFLHGLTGHREKTWTAIGEDEPWPKSLLSKDLPTARIITYGYDARVVKLTGPAGLNTVREHATNLINDLATLRIGVAGRPIIFVAHSLGGLVCQDALLVCKIPTEDAQRDILSSTCGIAFLGTPHAGSDLTIFAAAAVDIVGLSLLKRPNKKLIEVLGRKSEILANIKNEFSTVVRLRLGEGSLKPIALHVFIEELPLELLGRRVVEPDSAKIPGYNFDTIHANHMEMTKFRTAADPGYTKIMNRLKSWIDDNSIVLYSNDLRLKFKYLWPDVELAKSEPPAPAKQLCESSNIEPSLKWFKNSSEYRAWKQARSAKLWLHGEHGDGKTVIMSYILRSLTRHALDANEQGLASIFCSRNDSEEGVVASLSLQLLQSEDRAKASQSKFPISEFHLGDSCPDFTCLLWGLLKMLVMACPETVLIIDGIDKLDFPVRSSFLDRFGKLEEEVTTTNMRVLISSEKNGDIQSALSRYSSIDREKERRECLKTLEFEEWNAREIGVQEVEGAGRRFFDQPEYRSWIQSGGSSVLWLEGKPGSGKSTLAKFMVKTIEKDPSLTQARRRNPSHNSPHKGEEEWIFNKPTDKSVIIARFYYSFRGGNTQTSHELMLRSIVHQIWSENSKLFSLIRDRYQELKSEVSEASEQKSFWSYDNLKWVLESLCRVDFNLRALIIVDGMDESNYDKRVDILTFLLDLAKPISKSSCIINIFIASRPENDINSRLQQVRHHIKLQEVNEEDIRIVAEGWIKRVVLESKCDEETLLEVKDYITKYSDGVFLWVTLVLRDLEQYIDNGGYTKLTLNTRLRSLPKELGGNDGFYRAMINSLVEKYKEDREQQERGRRILAWVTFVERPISVIELRDALATPPKLEGTDLSTYVLEDNRPQQLYKAILSSCGGLAEVRDTRSGQIVQLIHQTVREFLVQKDKLAEPYHLEEVQGDMEIALSCCRYLSIAFRPDFPPAEANAKLPQVEILAGHLSRKSLLAYALMNFQTHLRHLGSNNEKVRDEFMDFVKLLVRRSNSYASLLLGQWIQALNWPTNLHVDETSARLFLHFLLLYAAETGKKEVAEVLLSLRSDLIHIEAGKGGSVTMEQLLENGPPVSIQSIIKRDQLNAANDHESGLQLLCDIGADVDSKDIAGRTPISYAAENGHEGSISILLRNGASVDSKDSVGRTPLLLAAMNSHSLSFELLLRKGANIDLKDPDGRTPLSYAAENGDLSGLNLLFQKRANMDSKDLAGRTPLSYAAGSGDLRCLELLLDKRANINSKDSAGRTPLSYAAGNGHKDSVKLLLRRGDVECNSEDATGRTPLSYAAENGHTDSVRALLWSDNVEFYSKDTSGRTPLSYAVRNRHEAVVKLLQSHITT